jgi:hypothetical protein
MTARWLGRSLVIVGAVTVMGTLYATWEDSARARELEAAHDVIRELQDSLTRCATFRPPADGAFLSDVAVRTGVPVPLLWAMAIVESGPAPTPNVRGRHGEVGRLQVRREIWGWRFAECRSQDEQALVICGARILAALRRESASWREAVARYNATADPERAGRYVQLVEQRLGRMYLEGLR